MTGPEDGQASYIPTSGPPCLSFMASRFDDCLGSSFAGGSIPRKSFPARTDATHVRRESWLVVRLERRVPAPTPPRCSLEALVALPILRQLESLPLLNRNAEPYLLVCYRRCETNSSIERIEQHFVRVEGCRE
jgi:hypothetical protein